MDGGTSLGDHFWMKDSAARLWNSTLVVRQNFYAVTPGETSFAAVHEVPNYVAKVRSLVKRVCALSVGSRSSSREQFCERQLGD